ncbi:MAG: TetR family transcriptional regulator [Solirubrobacteraceae bacterium]
MQHSLGLRERKKAQTRETIIRCAMGLFAERGFDATTIADIAKAADIAPRTFFGYFPSKEAVVFHDFDEMFTDFASRLRERPEHQTAFEALRSWIVEMITRAEENGDGLDEERRRCLISDTPSLDAHERANMGRFHELLTECVAVDLDVAADSLRANMVSAAAIAALESLRELKEDESGPEQAIAVMDEVLVFLQGGLDALRAPSEAGTASE